MSLVAGADGHLNFLRERVESRFFRRKHSSFRSLVLFFGVILLPVLRAISIRGSRQLCLTHPPLCLGLPSYSLSIGPIQEIFK
jgi:hypothetical protein